MCGGYRVYSEKIKETELLKFFSPEQVEEIMNKEFYEGHFWDPRPLLPVEVQGQISFFDWGNRDKKAPFPTTGWAKQESIEKGRWNWLHPKAAKIPIVKGLEKGVWFDLPEGTEGLLVEKEDDKRVYMITEAASDDYKKHVKHERMPVGKKKNYSDKK